MASLVQTRRSQLEKIGKKLGVKGLDDWYQVSPQQLRKHAKFLRLYDSFFVVLKKLYPEHSWDPLKLHQHAHGSFFNDEFVQRTYLEKFGRERFGIKTLDDWYNVPTDEVLKKFNFVRRHYKGSLSIALMKLYPNHEWDVHRFVKVPKGFWSSEEAQRDALERFGKSIGIKELDDWYSISASDVKELSGVMQKKLSSTQTNSEALGRETLVKSGVKGDCNRNSTIQQDKHELYNSKVFRAETVEKESVKDDWNPTSDSTTSAKQVFTFISKYYNGSLFNALKKIYPNHNWDPQKLSSRVPRGHWSDQHSQLLALETLGRERFGVKELDDWYSVPTKEVTKELNFILHHYGSLFNALKALYPQHDWDPLKLSKRVPQGHWKSEAEQRAALERLGEKLGVKELDDWYQLSTKDVKELSFIWSRYNTSLFSALKHLIPEKEWDPLQFKNPPLGFWKDPSTLQHYHKLFQSWKEQHDIQDYNQWFSLPPKQVRVVLQVSKKLFGNLSKMLTEWFPGTDWGEQAVHSTPQLHLQVMLQGLLSNVKGKYTRDRIVLKDMSFSDWTATKDYQLQRVLQNSEYHFQRSDKEKDFNLTHAYNHVYWDSVWLQLRALFKC